MNNQNTVKTSSFERYSAFLRKTLSGVPFLILSIMISVAAFFKLMIFFSNLDGTLFLVRYDPLSVSVELVLDLLELTFYSLLTAGCWCLFAGAVNRNNNSNAYLSKLGFVRPWLVLQLVFSYIVTICVGIVAILYVLAMAGVPQIADIFGESMNAVFYSSYSLEYIYFAEHSFGGTGIIILIALVVVFVLGVLTILRWSSLCKMTRDAKRAALSGIAPAFKPMFFAVISFVFAGFELIAFLNSTAGLINGEDILQSLLNIILTITVGVVAVIAKCRYNSEMLVAEAPVVEEPIVAEAPVAEKATEAEQE